MCVILITVGIIFSYKEFKDDEYFYFLYVLIILGIVISTFLWKRSIDRYFSKYIYFLVEHKFFRKIIAGGSFSFYQYKDPLEKKMKSKFTGPISQIITLIFAFVGIATIILGFLYQMDPEYPENPFVWGILTVLVPILATPLIPVTWALEDAKVKAWASGNKTTWMVSARYKRRFNSFISIGAIFSNLRDPDAGNIIDQLEIMLDIVRVGLLIMFISVGFFILIYYIWFRKFLRIKLKSTLSLKMYNVVLFEYEDPDLLEIGNEEEENENSEEIPQDQVEGILDEEE
jgi:hypothetical protein